MTNSQENQDSEPYTLPNERKVGDGAIRRFEALDMVIRAEEVITPYRDQENHHFTTRIFKRLYIAGKHTGYLEVDKYEQDQNLDYDVLDTPEQFLIENFLMGIKKYLTYKFSTMKRFKDLEVSDSEIKEETPYRGEIKITNPKNQPSK
jgi:hypothetical protein